MEVSWVIVYDIITSWSSILLLLLVAAAAAWQWVGWLVGRRLRRLPPGPIPIPVLGNLVDVLNVATQHGHLPHVALARFALKYGPIFHLQLGSVSTIFASSPSIARHILSSHDSSLSSRPHSDAVSRLFYHTHMSAFMSPYSRQWLLTRKFYSLHIFHPRSLPRSHLPLVSRHTLRFVFSHLYASSLSNSPLDLSALFSSLLQNIMYLAVLGKLPSDLSTIPTPQLYALLPEVDRLLGLAHIGTFFPALRFLDWRNNRAMDRCHRAFDAIFEEAISSHIDKQHDVHTSSTSARNDEGHTCVLDALLASDPPVERDRMKAMMMELIVGGSHTTALALEWAMAELLSNESVMRKVVEEIDREVGKARMVAIEDVMAREKMAYLRAVVKETLRLHPPAPLLLPHLAMETCDLNLQQNGDGESCTYRIPANTSVVINAWAIGRDEATWGPTASAFVPERFLPHLHQDGGAAAAGVDFRGQHFQLLPFGAGRRMCPGLPIAIPTIEFILATFLHCFRWATPAGISLDLSEKLGITLPPRSHLLAVPTDFRLESHLLLSNSHLLIPCNASFPTGTTT